MKMRDFMQEPPGRMFTENNLTHPYYIVTHAYTRKSAGIRVLHFLCNALNSLGYRASLVIHPQFTFTSPASPFLNTPVLTRTQLNSDYQMGLTPITIYPEMIGANLFNAPVAFEYLLNFKGLLGGASIKSTMPQIAYSEQIRRKSPGCDITLFIPTSDPRVFHPPENNVKRHGVYFYAAKYQSIFGKITDLPEQEMIEILRSGPMAQTTEDLIKIYKSAERIYVYENTAVATEAAMCGCPVIFMPSDFLDSNITEFELGTYGMAWGNSSNEVKIAYETVERFYRSYIDTYNLSLKQLEMFIKHSQHIASQTSYNRIMKIPQIDISNQAMLILDNTYGILQKIIYKFLKK